MSSALNLIRADSSSSTTSERRSLSATTTEINDLGHRHAVVGGDQDVGGLEVAMNDAFLMRMLHRVADLDKQLQPFLGGEIMLIAVLGDLYPPHQLHHEVGPTGFSRASLK